MGAVAAHERSCYDVAAVTHIAFPVIKSLGQTEAQKAAIELDGTVEVGDGYPDVPDPRDADAHPLAPPTRSMSRLLINATCRIVPRRPKCGEEEIDMPLSSP